MHRPSTHDTRLQQHCPHGQTHPGPGLLQALVTCNGQQLRQAGWQQLSWHTHWLSKEQGAHGKGEACSLQMMEVEV